MEIPAFDRKMHITRIELENIKSHANSTFEFSSGTIAVTGRNGAGKTTIVESIAWALFDLLDHKKEDFVRRGEKKGCVRITFLSGLDEREYTVYRDTNTGYYVYDPRLMNRIAEKRDEVKRFLWQHLGVEPGTDLETLFRRAIGVPQGTYTAIFLESAAERKKAFDKLLKVEDYRRGADELLKTSRYLQEKLNETSNRISRAEGELSRADSIESDHKAAKERLSVLGSDIEKLAGESADLAKSVSALDLASAEVEKQRTQREKALSAVERSNLRVLQAERDLLGAQAAYDKLREVEADNLRHTDSLAMLRELERERGERDKLKDELSKIELSLQAVAAEKKRLDADIVAIAEARRIVEALKPVVATQEQLEAEIHELQNRAAAARALKNTIGSLEQSRERLRESYRENQAQLAEAREKSRTAESVDELQKRDSEMVMELARLRAALDRDEKFQNEIKNGLCPILSQKCLNLKDGETLESFVTSQFSELRAEIVVVEGRKAGISESLRASLEAEKFLRALEAYQARAEEIRREGEGLNEEIATLEKQVKDVLDAEKELSAAVARLTELENPKAKTALLEKDLGREFDLKEEAAKIESSLERLSSDRQFKLEQLESYLDVDSKLEECCKERDRTANARSIYLTNEAAAGMLDEKAKASEAERQEAVTLKTEFEAAEKNLSDLNAGYDRDRHTAERTKLIETETRLAECRATFAEIRSRETELSAELERLSETRLSMRGEHIEKERLEKVAEATSFIRDTLKEAAPRVARNYVHHISMEANQLFREISGNPERTLKWTEDYGIALEENGHERPFANLSGGEQMAAALSVRLALLKQLSDIRIAFFDEPTTNMDAERRENLAQQIGNIKHFDQLFVISHDDTFEGCMDHEIKIGE